MLTNFIKVCVLTYASVATVAAALAVGGPNYPLYDQCNSKWGSQMMGSKTVCQAGCLISSIAMGMKYYGRKVNGQDADPGTVNAFFKANGGYSGNSFIHSAINKVSGCSFTKLHWDNDIPLATLSNKINNGEMVVANVRNGGHWVLATGVSGNDVKVNDPGYWNTSYKYSEIVAYAVYNCK